MMTFGELGFLSTVMKEGTLGRLGESKRMPNRSLAELVDLLRAVESPPQAIHKGVVCDPALRFRAAVSDVYNSVSGLTLFDVSGRAHGWGLSRHLSEQVQAVLTRVLKEIKRREVEGEGLMMGLREDLERGQEARLEIMDEVRLVILRAAENAEDLRAAAVVDKGFWRVYRSMRRY